MPTGCFEFSEGKTYCRSQKSKSCKPKDLKPLPSGLFQDEELVETTLASLLQDWSKDLVKCECLPLTTVLLHMLPTPQHCTMGHAKSRLDSD